MPLIILSDNDVREVLDTLTRKDVLDIHQVLADALHSYSTATNAADSGCCSANQPSRIALKNKDGEAILFMPAMSDSGMGVKVVTLGESHSNDPSRSITQLPVSESPVSSRQGSIYSHDSTPRSGSPSGSGSLASTNTSYSSNRTSISAEPKHPGLIIPGTPLPPTAPSSTSPRGSITLLTPSGEPRALLNASTLTAFRTALVSTLLLKARSSVHTITVFGAGLQAYWHVYLSVLLRGDEIHHLHIINRDFTRAQMMVMQLVQTNNTAVSDVMLSSKIRPSILTPKHGEYTRLLKENVRAADVIYCCTPSSEPLFPASHLTHTGGRRKARYVVAIGSYKPHMQELHEDIIRQAVRPPDADSPHSSRTGIHVHQRHASEGGAIIVDTIEGATREAGEIIRAGIEGHAMVEIGELVMLKRGHRAMREEQQRNSPLATDAPESPKQHHGLGKLLHLPHHLHHEHHDGKEDKESGKPLARAKSRDREGKPLGRAKSRERERAKSREREGDGGLMNWLERGNVIYKSVGLGLMDVVVGMEIVRLAEERGIGVVVPDF